MINELLQHTLAASRQLVTLDDATINRILIDTASALLTRQAEVLAANVEDLSRIGPGNPKLRPLETDGRTSRRYCRRYEKTSPRYRRLLGSC